MVLAGAAVLALLSKRSWAWITALVTAGFLVAVSILGAFTQMTQTFDTIDASDGFLSAIVVGLLVVTFTVWSKRRLTRPSS